MIDTDAIRNRLHQRIAQAERVKMKDQPTPTKDCLHEWQVFRQTVIPNSERFKGTGAYFIVKACLKCHGKRTVDYIVEK